jgi:hypothetical protein
VTSQPSRARLLNSDHELVAEGTCVLDEPAGHASLEVERTPGVIHSQHGNLSLELDSGRSLLVSDKLIVLMITPPGEKPSPENRRKIFRLRLVDPMAAIIEQEANSAEPETLTQDASAVDAAGQGRPAVSLMGRLSAEGRGETPAAR